jgi:hypothetical protein
MKCLIKLLFGILACLWLINCSSSTKYITEGKATNLDSNYKSNLSINFRIRAGGVFTDVETCQKITEKILKEYKFFKSYYFLENAWHNYQPLEKTLKKNSPNADFTIELAFSASPKVNPGFLNIVNVIISGTTFGLFPVFADMPISLYARLLDSEETRSMYLYDCSALYYGEIVFGVTPYSESVHTIEIEPPTYVIEKLVKDALFKLTAESPLKEFNLSNK